MAEKEFSDFEEAVAELTERDYRVLEFQPTGYGLNARYQGRSLLRGQDQNLSARISKKQHLWVVEASDELYCSRVLFTLTEPAPWFNSKGNLRREFTAKEFHSDWLERGVPHQDHSPRHVELPLANNTRDPAEQDDFEKNSLMYIDPIIQHFKDQKYEIFTRGFNAEELELLHLTDYPILGQD